MLHKPNLLVCIVVLMALLVADVGDVAACSWTISPNPWFSATLRFDNRALPPGITLRHVRTDAGNEILVTNPTLIPFYLVSGYNGQGEVREIGGLGAAQRAAYKVVGGTWFGWESYKWATRDRWNAPIEGPRGAWDATANVLQLNFRNEPNRIRPADVQLPAAQHTWLPVVYGDRVVPVPVDITYVLNPDYVPLTESERIERAFEKGACQSPWMTQTICISAIVLVSLLMFIGLRSSTKVETRPINTDL